MSITQHAMLDGLVTFTYTNYKGVTEDRKVTIYELQYGSTEHHKDTWMLCGHCHTRKAYRNFDLAKITNLKNYKED